MTTKTHAPTKKAKKQKQAGKEHYLALVAGQPIHGWICTWDAVGPHPHPKVVAALSAAGLEPTLARVLSAKSAWLRAARKLSDERVVEQFKQDGDRLFFQFTKAQFEAEGIEYKKEATVVLDTQLGKISCKVKEIQDLAQAKLDECQEARTTSDITKIVQTVFEQQSDLIPVRSQGGAYFVPVAQAELVDRVTQFLVSLGGKLNPWPIAKGVPSGDRVVADSVTDHLKNLIASYREAVASFTLSTRAATVEKQAEAIKVTKAKLEAYAEYLGDLKAGVAEELEQANAELLAKVEGLEAEKKEKKEAAEQNGEASHRDKLLGHSATAVVRWMGKHHWGYDRAKAALDHFKVGVAEATVRIQLTAGRRGQRGDPAPLTKEQAAELEKAAPAQNP